MADRSDEPRAATHIDNFYYLPAQLKIVVLSTQAGGINEAITGMLLIGVLCRSAVSSGADNCRLRLAGLVRS